MQRILALLAVLLMATGCASPLLLDDEGALAIVPYRISENGQIVIDVMVEGEVPMSSHSTQVPAFPSSSTTLVRRQV